MEEITIEEIQDKLSELEQMISDYRDNTFDNFRLSEAHRKISEAATLITNDRES